MATSGDLVADRGEAATCELSGDALELCMRTLQLSDLCRAASVCRLWREAASRDGLWRAQLARELHRPPAPPPGAARAAFELCLQEPAAQHKAWQARFHAAMARLGRWRATVLVRTRAAGDPPRPAGRVERAWRCRAVAVQHHEQSAWVRFHLPPALAADAVVVAACSDGRLEVHVEACCPSGEWLPLIVSAPFRLHLDDDRAMLLQSHREGLYAWDASEEGGGGQAGGADTASGGGGGGGGSTWWEVELPRGSGDDGGGDALAGASQWLDAAPPRHSASSGPLPAASGGAAAAAAAAPAAAAAAVPAAAAGGVAAAVPAGAAVPLLCMLAYLHYEQLLPALQGKLNLPQTFPLAPRAPAAAPETAPTAPAVDSTPDADADDGGDAGPDACAGEGGAQPPRELLLHLDFAQLRGCRGIGAVTARLQLRRWGAAAVQFEADLGGGGVAVALYGGEGEAGEEGGSSGQSWDALAGLSGGQDGGGGSRGGKSGGDEEGARSDDEEEGGAAGPGGGGDAAPGADATPRARLEQLCNGDEVMADLALFDGAGRLLLGRAGVEIWQKEGTTLLPAPDGSGMVAVHRTLHLLHFLVDGLAEAEDLWSCALTLDPAHHQGATPAHQQGGLITLRLSWRALTAMTGGGAAGDGAAARPG